MAMQATEAQSIVKLSSSKQSLHEIFKVYACRKNKELGSKNVSFQSIPRVTELCTEV
jgi:hypothetical protein